MASSTKQDKEEPQKGLFLARFMQLYKEELLPSMKRGWEELEKGAKQFTPAVRAGYQKVSKHYHKGRDQMKKKGVSKAFHQTAQSCEKWGSHAKEHVKGAASSCKSCMDSVLSESRQACKTLKSATKKGWEKCKKPFKKKK
jgi:hypothetical protein